MFIVPFGQETSRRLKSAWDAATLPPDWATTNKILRGVEKKIVGKRFQGEKFRELFPEFKVSIDKKAECTHIDVLRRMNGAAERTSFTSTKENPVRISEVALGLMEMTQGDENAIIISHMVRRETARFYHPNPLIRFCRGFKNPQPW